MTREHYYGLALALTTGVCALPIQAAAAGAPPTQPEAASPHDDPDAAGDSGSTVGELDVIASGDYAHQVGAVISPVPPELQYNPAQIRSLGVNTVSELLDELLPQTRSDRGRGDEAPIILLNGRQISSLSEVINLPTEAILRVDILPEEASLSYGYPAGQRVVNIVLRRHFHAAVAGLAGGASTDSARQSGQAEADLLRVHRDTRFNLDLKYKGASEITDASRDIIEPAPSDPFALAGNVASAVPAAEIDPALSALVGSPVMVAGVPAVAQARAPTLNDFAATAGVPNATKTSTVRTLAPATQSLTGNAVLARPIFGGIDATLNASFSASSSDSLHGLPGLKLLVPAGDPFSPFASNIVVDRYVEAPLRQLADSWAAHLGAVLNKNGRGWGFSFTGGYDHVDTSVETDASVDPKALQGLLNDNSASFNPFAPLPSGLVDFRPRNRAHLLSDSTDLRMLATGALAKLPAGDIRVTASAGDAETWLTSSSVLSGVARSFRQSRNDGSAQLSIDVPLASRRNRALSALGELTLNANASIDYLSDLGSLSSFGYGANWTPTSGYSFIVSFTRDQAPPTMRQLADPAVLTPGVRLFDYATGQTAEVTEVTGGDRRLGVETRDVLKVGLTAKPLRSQDLSLVVNYISSDAHNATSVLVAATPAIEAAFPSRFVRNAQGGLTLFDDRSITFDRLERSEIRWGINFTRHVGPSATPSLIPHAAAGGADGSLEPSSTGVDSSDAGAHRFRSRGTSAGARIQFALYHTLYLTDRETLRPGGPTLDLLRGDPASAAGGQYRNEVEGQVGVSRRGLGARLTVDWREATTVQTPGSPSGDLHFSDVTMVNLRLFANLGRRGAAAALNPWLRGTRIGLSVTNLLDQHVRVHDALGVMPLAYQAGYVDPAGRVITLSLRKLLF